MQMRGMLGPYSMNREASGTSWQPDSTPLSGIHFMKDDWMLMLHGTVNGIYDDQGGGRGDEKLFSTSMLMFMAQREAGPGMGKTRSSTASILTIFSWSSP